MDVMVTILAVVIILIALGTIYLVLQQDENDQGLGTLSGNTDSFYSTNKGRTKDVFLNRLTKILITAFIILNVVVNLMIG